MYKRWRMALQVLNAIIQMMEFPYQKFDSALLNTITVGIILRMTKFHQILTLANGYFLPVK